MKDIKILLFALISLGFSSCATAQKVPQVNAKIDSLAEKMLVYQLPNGAWPKQLADKSVVKYENKITETLIAKIKATQVKHATIDNHATTREINSLVKAYGETANKKYLEAVQKGIDYLLEAQYANGGWPQYYPDKSMYRAEITYNDDAMINVLGIMFNISNKAAGFEAVEEKYVAKSKVALEKGLSCILKTQVLQNGTSTIWAAQYDENTLQPAKARAFEPEALSASESVNIVRFLMKIQQPSAELKNAIENAVKWFDANKIVGFKFAQLADKKDKGLVADASSTIWARFYDLKTNKPIFGDRDNVIYTDVKDISYERRNGYAWYGTWGNNLVREYPKWLKMLAQK